MPLTDVPARYKSATRRKSVSAERYDPEADNDEEEKVIHPKTDEQRERLRQVMANLLIFKALDPVRRVCAHT